MDPLPYQINLFKQNINATDYWKLSEKLLFSYFPGPNFLSKRGSGKYESMNYEQRQLCRIGIGEEYATRMNETQKVRRERKDNISNNVKKLGIMGAFNKSGYLPDVPVRGKTTILRNIQCCVSS